MRWERVKSLKTADGGAVAATYALSLFAIVAVAGIAFDYSRLAGMHSELQNAADQAALAAASQLDGIAPDSTTGELGSCARAANAASGLLSNQTILANDESGIAVSIATETSCDAAGYIKFWQDKDKTTAATSDANANFVEVTVSPRIANYALTPVVGAFSSGQIDATAMAGLGSAICEVPPIMMCSPDPSHPFDAASKKGWGIQATGNGGSSWAPGDFGFLEVGTGSLADLAKAIAFKDSEFDCAPINGSYPETGNAQVLYDAVNTRFDIEPTSTGGGTTLNPCTSGSCPPALNVTKDLIKDSNSTAGNNACRIHNNGWHLPPVGGRFSPAARDAATETALTLHDADGSITAMGLTRDLCHYNSYNTACSTLTPAAITSNRFGNGAWARGDYFNKYHPVTYPSNRATITRYETYLWEIANSALPSGSGQYSSQLCVPGTADGYDRRVLSIAVVKNCSSLTGGSVPVNVDEWVDVFLVEPVVDDSVERANGRNADTIYVEVIGPTGVGSNGAGAGAQTVRKDVPYLVQ